ncbi:MAG TPA: M23 family metallopeptidase [Hyphomonadaceae bacterium]|nr:M23 family metallopeptidase [Hyphomonadaceae bacterium]
MIRTIIFAGATGVVGWLAGSIWPAPPQWTDAINHQANDLRAQLRLANVNFDGLQKLMPGDKFAQLQQQVTSMAAQAGEVIQVDHQNSTLEEELDNLALDAKSAIPTSPSAAVAPAAAAPAAGAKPGAATAPTPAPITGAPPGAGTGAFLATVSLCPKMEITNAPAHGADMVMTAYKPFVDVQGVKIATDPTRDACLSSGFGTRDGRLHKGIDFHAEVGVPIMAAGDGQIVEMKYRDDYGNMIVIDHGKGVYTRYAHMASFGRGLSPGVTVKAGDQIGLMGNTAGYQIPMHLHYELLTGDYNTPKQSFGLTPVNILDEPAAK